MKFIAHSTEYNTIERHVNAPLFKRVFDCFNSKNAKLTIVAVGLYRLFLNGEELNKSFFAPYMSNPDQVVVYDVYDIENKLKKKTTCFACCLETDLSIPTIPIFGSMNPRLIVVRLNSH